MNNSPSPDQSEFDRLLDQTLANYAAAKPRPGLELRILNTFAANTTTPARQRKFSSLWPWQLVAFSTFVTAALILSIWMHFHHVNPPPQLAHQVVAEPLDEVSSRIEKSEAPQVFLHRSRKHSVTSAPEREASVPRLTIQEELLAQLVARHPDHAHAIVTAEANLPKPISLPPLDTRAIHIDPLSTRPISVAPIQIASMEPNRSADPLNLKP